MKFITYIETCILQKRYEDSENYKKNLRNTEYKEKRGGSTSSGRINIFSVLKCDFEWSIKN